MKGENLILHIGYPRTGTTWLQEEFFPRVENYTYRRHIRSIILGKEKLVDFPKNLIMSDEEIVNIRKQNNEATSYPQTIFPNYSYILDNYKQIKIVVFIRNQIDLLSSSFSYLSHLGKFKNFASYFSYLKEFKYKQWLYYSHLQFFEEIPNSKLFVYLFEDFINNPNSTIKKLSFDLDLEIDISKVNLKKKNASPPHFFIPLIIFSNKIHPLLGNKLFFLTQSFPGKRFKIPLKYITKIRKMFARENKLFDEKYDLGMKRYMYY